MKIIGRNRILDQAGGFLIAAVMVFSLTAVIATTQSATVTKNNAGIGSRSVTLLNEGFEGGVMPPEGWSTIVYNPEKTWQIVTDPVHTGTYAAKCPRSSYAQDEWFTSPVIDLTYYYTAELKFWANTNLTGAPGMYCDVVIQGDGIDDVIWEVTSETDWTTYAWREKTLDLSGYKGKVITISWRYYGDVGKKDFTLDDVLVTGVPLTDPPKLEIGAITSGLFKINAEIKNVGTEDTGYNVTWNMTAIGNGVLRELNFSANGTIPKLDPNGGTAMVVLEKATETKHQWIVGFGKLTITVEADIPDNPRVEPVKKSVTGLLFFVIVVNIQE